MAGDQVPEPDQVLLRITEVLERLGLRYAIGGSVAASIHGIARSTRDLDILVELPPASLPALLAEVREDFYVPVETARAAVTAHSSFNLIHLQLQFKVDLFVAGSSPLDHEELERVVRVAPVAGSPRTAAVASPEVMVLRKLDWFRRGGGLSDRQWFDVLGILKVQAGRLDEAWMRRAAAGLGVGDLLDRALRLQGPPPR
jgi:hypothetical protein